MPQSVISDYERGRRDPSIGTLRRLLDPLGFDITISLVRRVGTGRELQGTSGSLVRERRDEIVAALKELGATRVWVYGEVVEGIEDQWSAIRLHADLRLDASDYWRPKDAMMELLGWDTPVSVTISFEEEDGSLHVPAPPFVELTDPPAEPDPAQPAPPAQS